MFFSFIRGSPNISVIFESECDSHSVVSNSMQPSGLYSSPGSSVHGILQARILEWVTIPFSRGSSWPRDRTQVSCTAAGFLTIWATWEAHSFRKAHINIDGSMTAIFEQKSLPKRSKPNCFISDDFLYFLQVSITHFHASWEENCFPGWSLNKHLPSETAPEAVNVVTREDSWLFF